MALIKTGPLHAEWVSFERRRGKRRRHTPSVESVAVGRHVNVLDIGRVPADVLLLESATLDSVCDHCDRLN